MKRKKNKGIQKNIKKSGDIKVFGSANTKSMTDSLVLFTDRRERK